MCPFLKRQKIRKRNPRGPFRDSVRLFRVSGRLRKTLCFRTKPRPGESRFEWSFIHICIILHDSSPIVLCIEDTYHLPHHTSCPNSRETVTKMRRGRSSEARNLAKQAPRRGRCIICSTRRMILGKGYNFSGRCHPLTFHDLPFDPFPWQG